MGHLSRAAAISILLIVFDSCGAQLLRDPFQPPPSAAARDKAAHYVGLIGDGRCWTLWQVDDAGRWYKSLPEASCGKRIAPAPFAASSFRHCPKMSGPILPPFSCPA